MRIARYTIPQLMDKMLFCNDGFGAIIISSTYENGQGVITFDGTVTSINF